MDPVTGGQLRPSNLPPPQRLGRPEPVLPPPAQRFDGDTYVPVRDCSRLTDQLQGIKTVMADGGWYTLGDIEERCGHIGIAAPQASASARLRDLRKAKHGSRVVEKRWLGNGLWQYRLVPVEEPWTI